MSSLNLIDYEISKRLQLGDIPFYALIAAAMRRADTNNLEILRRGFPQIAHDLQQRYNAPGGIIPEDKIKDENYRSVITSVSKVADTYMKGTMK